MAMNAQTRHPLMRISIFGITYLYRQNPYLVAWWSAMFPGFGHYILNQYIRGTLLTLTEVIINTLAHINEAIVFSFCGQYEQAQAILEPKWAFGYLAIYFFAIVDSFRLTITQNKLCQMAELEFENTPFSPTKICSLEIQYIECKNPRIAAIYSFLFPGLGQLYNQHWLLGFYAMFFWWYYLTLSNAHASVLQLVLGNIDQSIAMLKPHWLLFMPSVMGGSIYHAYRTSIEHNRLYRLEQRKHLTERYRHTAVRIFS